jgi:hypothetical protein
MTFAPCRSFIYWIELIYPLILLQQHCINHSSKNLNIHFKQAFNYLKFVVTPIKKTTINKIYLITTTINFIYKKMIHKKINSKDHKLSNNTI